MLSFFSPAPRPADEESRQGAVERCGIREAVPLRALQEIVAHAARLFDTPMAALSIIDRDRQWFAARIGIAEPETARAVSFCAHAILTPAEPFVVRDARLDERFAGNPLVLHDMHLRFYAGVPVRLAGDHAVGALCVLDRKCHDGPMPLDQLTLLADRASSMITSLASRT